MNSLDRVIILIYPDGSQKIQFCLRSRRVFEFKYYCVPYHEIPPNWLRL